MFRNTFQKGFLSVFYSCGRNPLLVWDTTVKNGHIKRLSDEDIKSMCLEMIGRNVATCFISAPAAPCPSLGIKLPFMVLAVKNMHKYFSIEVQILDDGGQLRRFRGSNYQSKTTPTSFYCPFPLAFNNPGWNEFTLNLAEYTERAYGTNYLETVRIQVHANCRIRHIYFCDRLYTDDEKPIEYKIVKPVRNVRPARALLAKKKKPGEIPAETLRPGTPATDFKTEAATDPQA
jgi:hypothetical protein